MIAYYGPYNSRTGRARALGQDAVITPAPAAPAAPPTPAPFGSGAPGGPTPPPAGPSPAPAAAAPAPAPAAPSQGWMVNIAGKDISGWTIVLSALVVAGGIAVVAFTTEDVDKYYARKT